MGDDNVTAVEPTPNILVSLADDVLRINTCGCRILDANNTDEDMKTVLLAAILARVHVHAQIGCAAWRTLDVE